MKLSPSWGAPLLAAALFLPLLRADVSFSAGEPAYVVARPASEQERRMEGELVAYLGKVLEVPPNVVESLAQLPAGKPAILLATGTSRDFPGIIPPEGSPEAYALRTTEQDGHSWVVAVGATEEGYKRAIQKLILASEQRPPGLVIPDLVLAEKPWIARREWSEPSWSPEFVRGVWHNPNADRRNDIWLYGPEQIGRYVEMLDWLGYNGGELHDTAIAYANLGSADTVEGRLKSFAHALRSVGDRATLWVWAAQFNGFGWVDRDVVTTPVPGKTAWTDPRVRASFERYYDRYARLAPDVDLLVAHFYDPGVLKDRADVFAYMRLLMDKFQAANPRIQLGVDSWYLGSEAEYMHQLVAHGFQHVLFLENTMPHTYGPGKREALHAAAKAAGLELGVWGWHTAEIETDQNPNMYVNAKLLSGVYRQIHDGADRIYPISYWSEMEAYHLNNIFTHYAAAQLLWNPFRNPDELLHEISEAIWGPRNGPEIYDALQLIQDVRTGPSWDTYWVFLPTHRLGTPDPKDDLRRAEAAIANLEAMRTDPNFVPKIPLPFPPGTFVQLMLPHLRQIRDFAQFRIAFAGLETAAKSGTPKDELKVLAEKAWIPVPDYTNWVGMFGPIEEATQEQMLEAFAKAQGIQIAAPGWLRWRDANRQLEALQTEQRSQSSPYQFNLDASLLWKGFHWSLEHGRDRVQLLIDSGVLVKTGERYQLANWEDYRLP